MGERALALAAAAPGSNDAPSVAQPQIERCGPFVLLDAAGRGGTAKGHRAAMLIESPEGTIEKKVWIKRTRSSEPLYLEALRREGRVAAGLRHQNIVPLVAVDPDLYLAYELVDGVDLRQLLAATGQLPPTLTVHIVAKVAEALRHAHTRVRDGQLAGIVHCDVSPANILISFAGEVLLTDFGLAQPVRSPGRRAGKPPYMAPEQWFAADLIDGRVDIFALGVCMYEMLTGERPATGTDDEIFAALSSGEHKPLQELAPGAPSELVEIVERALAPEASDRYANTEQLLRALVRVPLAPTAACLELGELVRAKREYKTIDRTTLAAATREPTGQSHHVTPTATELSPRAPALPRVARRAYIAVAAVVLLAGAGLAATQPHDTPPPQSQTTTQPAKVLPAPPVQRAETAENTEAPEPLLERGVSPPPNAPLAQATAEPAAPPIPARATPKPLGALSVGSVPPERVWIDGIKRGWSGSGSKFRLPPGEHLVVVGESADDPRRKSVTITPNKVVHVSCVPAGCE